MNHITIVNSFIMITHWNMVGNAVTKNRPLNAGDVVTSICPVLMFKSLDHSANLFQVGAKLLHAGHHGA